MKFHSSALWFSLLLALFSLKSTRGELSEDDESDDVNQSIDKRSWKYFACQCCFRSGSNTCCSACYPPRQKESQFLFSPFPSDYEKKSAVKRSLQTSWCCRQGNRECCRRSWYRTWYSDRWYGKRSDKRKDEDSTKRVSYGSIDDEKKKSVNWGVFDDDLAKRVIGDTDLKKRINYGGLEDYDLDKRVNYGAIGDDIKKRVNWRPVWNSYRGYNKRVNWRPVWNSYRGYNKRVNWRPVFQSFRPSYKRSNWMGFKSSGILNRSYSCEICEWNRDPYYCSLCSK